MHICIFIPVYVYMNVFINAYMCIMCICVYIFCIYVYIYKLRENFSRICLNLVLVASEMDSGYYFSELSKKGFL